MKGIGIRSFFGPCLPAFVLNTEDKAWKLSKCGVFSGPYFPAFGLSTKRYRVSLCIQSECLKIQTRKTQNTDTFHALDDFLTTWLLHSITQADWSTNVNHSRFIVFCFIQKKCRCYKKAVLKNLYVTHVSLFGW